MTTFGYFLASEEHSPAELVRQARLAEQAGFELPRHFAQLAELVSEDMVAESIPCGPDPETHVAAIRSYIDAGYDEVYVNQIGPRPAGVLRLLPRRGAAATARPVLTRRPSRRPSQPPRRKTCQASSAKPSRTPSC